MAKSQKIDNTGEVIGGFTIATEVTVAGWTFNNTSTAATVTFYEPTAVSLGSNPAAPSASGTTSFVLQIPANSTVTFKAPHIKYKDGLFAKTSASTCTGTVWYE